jgi:deazaflavin-dependent oxidoreductase (nitroreductase family)
MTDPGADEAPMGAGVDPMGAELAAWGRVLLLETRGRRTGLRRLTPVGYVEDPDRSLRIAAGSPDTDWALNLLVDPRCRASVAGVERSFVAETLSGEAAQETVVALILRYGTPAEGLGRGPVFRLVPVAADRA